MRGMATVAQKRGARFQHAFGRSAMRVVADRAVLIDGLMVMHEGATLFHVAGVTGLHHTVAIQQAGAGGAVNIMAIRASHLALNDGVMRCFVDLYALFLVASEAGFTLGAFVAHYVLGDVNLVAGRTGYITCLVSTAFPVRALLILGVAFLAGSVANICRRRCPYSERDVRFRRLARTFVLKVVFAGAMATCARRGARVCQCAVAGLADSQQFGAVGFIMAGCTCGVAFENNIFVVRRLG